MEIKLNSEILKGKIAIVSYILGGIISINTTFANLGWPKPMDMVYWLLENPKTTEKIERLENYNKVSANILKSLMNKEHRYGCDVYSVYPVKDGRKLEAPLYFLWVHEQGIEYPVPYGAHIRPEEEKIFKWGHDGSYTQCNSN